MLPYAPPVALAPVNVPAVVCSARAPASPASSLRTVRIDGVHGRIRQPGDMRSIVTFTTSHVAMYTVASSGWSLDENVYPAGVSTGSVHAARHGASRP